MTTSTVKGGHFTGLISTVLRHHIRTELIIDRFLKFRGNGENLQQRVNSEAWLEIPRLVENCEPC